MSATDWLLRGVIFGFVIGVTLTLLCGVVLAETQVYQDPSLGIIIREVVMSDSGIELAACNPEKTRCWSTCEKKMAEAMKAIGPYIDYGEEVVFGDALYRNPQTRLREEADRMDKRDAALRRWEAVMKECVK